MKGTPSIDDQIKALEDYREVRDLCVQKVQAVRDIHEAAGNLEWGAEAQREYARLIRNDDKLLDQLDELQERKNLIAKSAPSS
jgi:hypothetical protein